MLIERRSSAQLNVQLSAARERCSGEARQKLAREAGWQVGQLGGPAKLHQVSLRAQWRPRAAARSVQRPTDTCAPLQDWQPCALVVAADTLWQEAAND